jgi:hypothetical protein
VKKRSVREGLEEKAWAHLFMEGTSLIGSSFMECVCVFA